MANERATPEAPPDEQPESYLAAFLRAYADCFNPRDAIRAERAVAALASRPPSEPAPPKNVLMEAFEGMFYPTERAGEAMQRPSVERPSQHPMLSENGDVRMDWINGKDCLSLAFEEPGKMHWAWTVDGTRGYGTTAIPPQFFAVLHPVAVKNDAAWDEYESSIAASGNDATARSDEKGQSGVAAQEAHPAPTGRNKMIAALYAGRAEAGEAQPAAAPWLGSIPAEESDEEFARQVEAMDAKREPAAAQEPHGERIWFCKIGGPVAGLPSGADAPMRDAVQTAFQALTGQWPEFTFSGWGGTLEECERAVVENRLPRPAASGNVADARSDEPKQGERGAQEQQDAARLDWLEAHPREGSIRLEDGTFAMAKFWAISADARWTIREAIDAALTQSRREE